MITDDDDEAPEHDENVISEEDETGVEGATGETGMEGATGETGSAGIMAIGAEEEEAEQQRDDEDESNDSNLNDNNTFPDDKLIKNSFLTKTTFDYCIPLGFNCNSAMYLKRTNNREYKLPFDWMQTSFDNYQKMLKDMKNNTVNTEIQHILNDNENTRVVYPYFTKIKKYDAWIPHEKGDLKQIELNYIKYFERLNKILTSNNIIQKNICVMITSFIILDDEIVKIYRTLLNELYPNNNYFFLTVNIGKVPVVTKDYINILNRSEDPWVHNIPLNHFFSKYLSSTKLR